jgi:predicted NUDIX family NTP pyrophosphohydrolase
LTVPGTSAALLLHRRGAAGPEVFLGHMGGPFWGHRDEGAWSIPKGLYDPALEDPLDAARREFAEEIGIVAPGGEVVDLGEFVQPSGKRVRTFAQEVHEPVAFVGSNYFELEWPRGSGVIAAFPEIDRADWFPIDAARAKVVGGQVPILDALRALVCGPGA